VSEPFLGEIRMFGGNFAPAGWAFCNGQLLPISQNTALFSLLGTTFGGNGVQTFALPDLRSRIPVGQGQGPGLQNYIIGEQFGQETVTLTASQLGSHSHAVSASSTSSSTSPSAALYATSPTLTPYSGAAPSAPMAGSMVGNNSGGQPHNNIMPNLCVSFIIALQGVFPSRN